MVCSSYYPSIRHHLKLEWFRVGDVTLKHVSLLWPSGTTSGIKPKGSRLTRQRSYTSPKRRCVLTNGLWNTSQCLGFNPLWKPLMSLIQFPRILIFSFYRFACSGVDRTNILGMGRVSVDTRIVVRESVLDDLIQGKSYLLLQVHSHKSRCSRNPKWSSFLSKRWSRGCLLMYPLCNV